MKERTHTGHCLWKSLGEFEVYVKVGHVDVHQKNLFPGSKGD